jgi:hypothetical protein
LKNVIELIRGQNFRGKFEIETSGKEVYENKQKIVFFSYPNPALRLSEESPDSGNEVDVLTQKSKNFFFRPYTNSIP